MAKVEYVDSLDLRTAKYTRHYNDGTEICADLTEGPNAFAIVKIKDEVITTEMPNLTLRIFRNMEPANKKGKAKAKGRPKKRPSGESEKKDEAESKEKAKVIEIKTGLYADGKSWSSDEGGGEDDEDDAPEDKDEEEEDEQVMEELE